MPFTFTKSVDTELERLEQLLSRQEARIRQAFAEFVAGAQSEAVIKEVTDLLEVNDVEAALAIVDRYIARMSTVLPTVYQQAAAVELPQIAAQISPLLPTVAISFDPTDARAAAVMRQATLSFIREFSDAQRAATSQALVEAFQTGAGTAATARAFRDSIGLTAFQENAVRNYRRLLQEGSGEALGRQLRDRRFDPSVRRASRGGEPLSADQVDRMTDAYRRRFLAYRAEAIARTEAVPAVSVARELALRQNIEAAGIPADAVTGTWRTTKDGRQRETHDKMNWQDQPLGRPFESPSGALLLYPGDPAAPIAETIQCRCHRTFRIDMAALRIAA